MAKVKFKREFLIDELELPENAVEEKIVGQSRWSTQYKIVFQHEGKHFQTTYSAGSTENQDESPWEYEEEVECTEVHKVPKTVEVWEPVTN